MKDRIDLTKENPVGLWEVTTEGDCEGRSVRNLGIWEGHVADIALHLAERAYYGLRFRKLNRSLAPKKVMERKSVHISMDIETGTWDMDRGKRKQVIRTFFENAPLKAEEVTVEDSNYYASVKITGTGKPWYDDGNE